MVADMRRNRPRAASSATPGASFAENDPERKPV